ncbi:MAG: azurin [Pseudomonadota bacterium]
MINRKGFLRVLGSLGCAAAVLFSGQAAAAECDVEVSVGDTLAFSTKSIEVPSSCETVTVKLTHTGSMAKNLMGHNWVLTQEADLQAVATAGMTAGVDGNYLPEGDARVLAATDLIGGGESASVSFASADLEAGKSYAFFCSFPGHWAVMRGTFKLV